MIEEKKPTYDELKAHVARLRKWIQNCNQYASILQETPAKSLTHIQAQVEEETIARCEVALRNLYCGIGKEVDPINAIKYMPRKYAKDGE